MSARFVRFTHADSLREILVNVDHIAEVWPCNATTTTLYQDFCIGDDGPVAQAMIVVIGSLDDVERLLNGEPAEQLRQPLTVSPRGWEFHDVQKGEES